MDERGPLLSIGEVSRRTGVPVKTIRFYSDRGLVLPAARSAAGYRLYDLDAFARLDLVRTLRGLGLDLASIQRVLDRQESLADLADVHARALEARIRDLRLRRAVLLAVARRRSTPKETELMSKLARMSATERRALISTFIDEVCADLEPRPDIEPMLRSAMPDLPDEPGPEQVEAWIELADLVQDPDFRASVRAMMRYQASQRAPGGGLAQPDSGAQAALAQAVREQVGRAIAEGLDPASAAARPVIDAIAAQWATAYGRPDDAAGRRALSEQIAVFADPRAEHYWQLLAIINGWPARPAMAPEFAWLASGLTAAG
ncbi:MAG: helix-turn-helix domain-containing protein [Streptosporangiaceae bacterium]